ncbi:Electron transfer flavoprotein, beta subunit [Candidatus Nitrosotalea sp. TS]|uniref:hypothetical protein n=1 Tax=Candidatus Nitrosotalea sp. TS TaxID=2341020 RepID=UPI001EC73C59|nr:hypothetical protein [Candidatus Nitrosotalea sp. TS]NHI03147.1 Electron transfer flavoprotein, beta subunit [Candidatus Nitrosotalea sp. TS]
MGPPMAESMLQHAQLMSDADELCLYSDRVFAGADTLATAEVLKAGVQKMNGKMDIVFSGHRASDGETGQTGPQTAWKLGMTFLGHVIDYEINLESRTIRAKRLVRMQGVYDVVEEIEAPLPVFIAIDPSYKPKFNTVSQRLAYEKYQKEAGERAQNFKQYLKVFNASSDRSGSKTYWNIWLTDYSIQGRTYTKRQGRKTSRDHRRFKSRADQQTCRKIAAIPIHSGDKMTEGDYRHVYIIIEHEEGTILQVSLEMLGEARRILDNFNKKYSSKEKVVAVLLGYNIKDMPKTLIQHGADASNLCRQSRIEIYQKYNLH